MSGIVVSAPPVPAHAVRSITPRLVVVSREPRARVIPYSGRRSRAFSRFAACARCRARAARRIARRASWRARLAPPPSVECSAVSRVAPSPASDDASRPPRFTRLLTSRTTRPSRRPPAPSPTTPTATRPGSFDSASSPSRPRPVRRARPFPRVSREPRGRQHRRGHVPTPTRRLPRRRRPRGGRRGGPRGRERRRARSARVPAIQHPRWSSRTDRDWAPGASGR